MATKRPQPSEQIDDQDEFLLERIMDDARYLGPAAARELVRWLRDDLKNETLQNWGGQ